jgi:hypothetical protein
MDILNLAYFAVRTYSMGILNFVTSPLVWVFTFVMFSQYKKIVSAQMDMYGYKVKYTLKDLISTAILSGLIAGFVATVITTVFGITFYKFNGLQFLILLSLLLMLINPRYICLSYSGGLLSIIVLILTSLVEGGRINSDNTVLVFLYDNLSFDVSALMALVALMHLIEATLMWFDGFRGAIPVFMKREGKVVGAFIMQRFWIIPMIFFIYMQ